MSQNEKTCICYAGFMHRYDDQRFVHKQCAALVKEGYEVVFFAQADSEKVVNGVKVLPVPKVKSLLHRFWMPCQLFPKLLKQKCRVYHFVDPELIIVGLILKLFFRKIVLFDAHEDYVEYARISPYLKGPIKTLCIWLFTCLLNICSKVYDGFVFGDEEVAAEYPNLKNRSICFHHYPLQSMFPESPIPFTERKYDIVYTGNLSEIKGAFEMLEVVRLLKDRRKDFKALFIGQPVRYIEERFNDFIKDNQLENYVEITGRLQYKEMSDLLNDCKVGLIALHDVPKFHKQSATKLFEFFAKGNPVVSVDLPPERKYMDPGIDGLLVPPQDAAAMAEAVYKIISNPEIGQEMAKACRNNFIAKKLYAECDCKKLIEFYDYVLKNPRKLFSRN